MPIGNKIKRSEVYHKHKNKKEKEKTERKLKRKREAEELGTDAPPPQVPKTLDNTREADDTTVAADDEEVQMDEDEDEFSDYFKRLKEPKIMITTRPKPSGAIYAFIKDIMAMVPNMFYYPRKTYEIRDMQKWAANKAFTHLLIIGEKNRLVNQMLMIHLPVGPCALFKISNYIAGEKIRGHGNSTDHNPEVILNRFTTRLGHRVGRFCGSLFSHNPEFRGRNVVTFHNQRDFVFVRFHRYMFDNNGESARLQELGCRFTLKLKWLMSSNFDPEHAEYEWIHKRKEMDASRRKFAL